MTDLKVLHEDEVEVCGKELVAEASQLGLGPGDWPNHIGVVNDERVGRIYAYRRKLSDGSVVYEAGFDKLTILND